MIQYNTCLSDTRDISSKEKDQIINQLLEKVQSLEDQKNSYKKLSDDLYCAYERMKQLYDIQLEKNKLVKEENKLLQNDLQYLKYILSERGYDVGDEIVLEENLIYNLKQQTNDLAMTRKHAGYIQNFSSSLAAGNNSANKITNIIDQSSNQKQKLTKQYSINSISSNGGQGNPKIYDNNQQEESEKIEIGFNQNQRNEQMKKKGTSQMPPPAMSDAESIVFSKNDKFTILNISNIQDEEAMEQAQINYCLNAKLGELLFQDFLLIGPSFDEIYGKCPIGEGGINAKNNKENTKYNSSSVIGSSFYSKNINDQEEAYFSQAILFDLIKGKLDESQQEVVSKHPFPFKVKCKKYRFKKTEDFQQDIDKKINTENKVQDIRQFIFSMEGENRMKKQSSKEKVPPVVDGSNPKQRLYLIYFEWDDFIFFEKDKNTLFKCPFAFCFITYYPFFTFFREVLCHIISKLQENRIPLLKINQSLSQDKKNFSTLPEQFFTLDATWIINEFEKAKIYKKKLFELALCKPEIQQNIYFSLKDEDEIDSSSTLNIQQEQMPNMYSINQSNLQQKGVQHSNGQPDYSSKVSFMVPHYKQLKLLETSQHSGSNLIFQIFTFDDFWMILTLVMLEQNIAFFSSNIQLVAGAMQTFSSIYKPFTNSNMPILHIFEGNLTFLESPFPFLSGINQNNKYIMQKKVICEDSQLVNFIDIDNKKIYLSSDTIKVFEDQNGYMHYTKYIYQLRKAYNILSIQQHRQHHQSLIATNFQSFENHQYKKLFNHMVFQHPPVPSLILQNYKNQQHQSFVSKAGNSEIKNSQIKLFTNVQSTFTNQLFGKQSTDTLNEKVTNNLVIDKENNNFNKSRMQIENSEEAKKILEYQKNQYLQMLKDIKSKAIEDIHELLEQTFQHYIIDNLPRENIDINSKNFNVQDFSEKILKKCEEKNFTKLFLQTQSFSYYFQQLYENGQFKPTTASTKASMNNYSTTANSQNKFLNK